MTDKINFEMILNNVAELPIVKVDRESFLRKQLLCYYDEAVVEEAIRTSPVKAGIVMKHIDKIADDCINYEATVASGLSFAAGIPGGFAMLGTIPADLTQIFAHMLIISQELAYLYGWFDFANGNQSFDDGSKNIFILFAGVMFGVDGTTKTMVKVCELLATKVEKDIVKKALTKGAVYPIVKKVATSIGLKMTKDIFARAVSNLVPIASGFLSGGMTYFSFRTMSFKLKNHLRTLKYAN